MAKNLKRDHFHNYVKLEALKRSLGPPRVRQELCTYVPEITGATNPEISLVR